MFSTLISMISHQEWQDSKIFEALFVITEEHIRTESNEPGVFIPVSSHRSHWMLLSMSHVTYPCLSLSDKKSSFLYFFHTLSIFGTNSRTNITYPQLALLLVSSQILCWRNCWWREDQGPTAHKARIGENMNTNDANRTTCTYNLGLWEQSIRLALQRNGTEFWIVACFSKMWGWDVKRS